MTTGKARNVEFKRKLWSEPGECRWCRCPLKFEHATVDHVWPLGLGGEHALANMVIACYRCNQERNQLQILAVMKRKASKGVKRYSKIAARMEKEMAHLIDKWGPLFQKKE